MTEAWFPTLFDDRLLLDIEKRCYPSVSDIQVFRYKDQPPAYQITGYFEGIRPLLKELDAPSYMNAIYCVRLASAAEVLKLNSVLSVSPENYCVERFGLRIAPFPARNRAGKLIAPVGKAFKFLVPPTYWSERSDYVVQVWRTRVFSCPVKRLRPSLAEPLSNRAVAMCLEEKWHPSRGKARSLHWLEPRDHSKHEVDQFKKDALCILDGTRPHGRPVGTRKIKTRDEFIRKYRRAYLKVRQRGELAQQSVADEMSISLSTFCRGLKEYNLKFPPDL